VFNSLSRPIALMFLLGVTFPAVVLAQTEAPADLRGVVLDAFGQPAAGYLMKITTSQWGEVILHPTEKDGTFVVSGLPSGKYEVRVFDPRGNPDSPIASKQVTLAAGQAEKIEIRVGSDNPAAAGSKSAAGRRATRTTLGTAADNWAAAGIFALVLAGGIVAFFVLRAQRNPGE
jgi:hypothetical protein